MGHLRRKGSLLAATKVVNHGSRRREYDGGTQGAVAPAALQVEGNRPPGRVPAVLVATARPDPAIRATVGRRLTDVRAIHAPRNGGDGDTRWQRPRAKACRPAGATRRLVSSSLLLQLIMMFRAAENEHALQGGGLRSCINDDMMMILDPPSRVLWIPLTRVFRTCVDFVIPKRLTFVTGSKTHQ
jgi:hypothetical protein